MGGPPCVAMEAAADASSKRSHEAADEPAAAASRPKFDLTRGSEPALGLLTALGVPRSEALGFLAERAVEKLIEAVPTMPARRRGMLLAASFAQIDSPRLRPVAVAALEELVHEALARRFAVLREGPEVVRRLPQLLEELVVA